MPYMGDTTFHRLASGLARALLLRPALVKAIIRRAQRTPYEHLAGYMERFWLVKPRRWTFGVGLRVHHVLRSDYDRDMHTHPWWNLSVILEGTYWEVMPATKDEPGAHFGGYVNLNEYFKMVQRKPGDIVFRRRTDRHKLMLFRGPVWTFFITGPETKDDSKWGYVVGGRQYVDRKAYPVRDAE